MFVVNATDLILYDLRHFKGNIEQFSVLSVTIKFLHVYYTALRILLGNFFIGLNGVVTTTIVILRLIDAIFAN